MNFLFLFLYYAIVSLQVHTDVVNRKTTITTFPDITFCCSVHSSESDTNEENMARGKRHSKRRKMQSNVQIKLRTYKPKRNCDGCYKSVANGIDMYRFYHTGLTVCKNCWITTDPSSDKTRRSRQIQSNLAEMKLCTVILTDVLSQESYKKKKIHQVEKDKDDDTSVDSSQEEAKSSESSPLSVSFKTRNHLINGKTKQGRKRKIDMIRSKDEYSPLKVTRLTKERINTNEVKLTKASVDTEQQSSTRFMKIQGVKRTIDDKSSDSDSSGEQRETHRNKLNDRVNKTNKKKHKSIHEKTTSNVLDSSDETSNEDDTSLRSKTRDATSSSNMSTKKEREERSTRSRTRSSSISSTEVLPKKSSVQSEVKIEYTCNKCNKKFDTKLSNAKHRLTHLKQAALKLEKITVSNVKEKQETDIDPQDDKISIETASRSGDKQTDDPSEEVAVNIEDTDDEEIFSLVSKKNLKRKNTKISGDNVVDKPDTVKSEEEESRLEEESKNDENIEAKEVEQSIVVPDETLEKENDENRKNKITRRKCMTKTKSKKTSENIDRDSDRSKEDAQETITTVEEDHNAGEEEDKNVKNDEEICSIEKEKISNECNNDDDEDFHEETIRDSETKSPILSSHNIIKDNKDHSENCENNYDNDKGEIIEEPEICDSIDESSKKNTKESEEEVQNIDKTETFKEKDLDDAIIINEDKIEKLEEQQNGSDEKNMEVDTVNVNEPSDVQDTTKSELSNNKKSDEIKDTDENDIAAVPVNSDNNDDEAKSKKIIEEILPMDDSKLEEEKEKFEEQLKELEEMVNDNAMNKHREVQENSTYVLDSNSADAANEILKEVFELAAAEVQHREENSNMKNLDDVEMETLENISREIRKSADMPSLDPISVMDIDDDMLN